MFIQTEETPNPRRLKFLPDQSVMENGMANFPTREEEEKAASPLASRFYEITSVISAFFSPDFISVTKANDRDWKWFKPQVFGMIMEHFTVGTPLFIDGYIKAGIENMLRHYIADRVAEASMDERRGAMLRAFKRSTQYEWMF